MTQKDKIYLEMALVLAKQSECEDKRGTIFVRDRRMISSAASEGDCNNSTSHSIQVAIHRAAQVGAKLEGSVCFTTHEPCKYCAIALERLGIIDLIYAYKLETG